MAQPQLLLADEPTGNLDSATGAAIMELLLQLREEHGTTLVIATHDMTLAARCDAVVRLRDGRVIDNAAMSSAEVDPDVLERIGRLA